MGFDSNALYRQPSVLSFHDETEEDPKELAASKFDLNYSAWSQQKNDTKGHKGIGEVKGEVSIYPLPHMPVIKDLIWRKLLGKNSPSKI